MSMFCQYRLWLHFSHNHFLQWLLEWLGTSLSPNVSSREEDGLPFSCPVWAEVRPPRQEFTTLLRPQNKPSSRFHLFAKSFCNPHQPSLSLRLGCFSTGLTAPPATPVKLAKLQLVEKKFNTSLKPLIRNLLMSNLHICESIFEKGRFVITKA